MGLEPRCRPLETIRQCAAEQLAQVGGAAVGVAAAAAQVSAIGSQREKLAA